MHTYSFSHSEGIGLWPQGKRAFFGSRWATLFLIAVGLYLVFPAQAQTIASFDLDTASPALTTGQNVPFDQTTGGITASFSAVAGAFSVQQDSSTYLTLSQFSGHYIYPNVANSVLVIQFSQPITNLTMDFATAEQTPIEQPTPIRVTAYTNSIATTPVGSTTLAGTYSGVNTLPMGTLAFNSATPFNVVRVNIEPGGATGLLVDNLTVSVAGAAQYTIATSASPTAGGTTSGGSAYDSGASVTVTASANAGYAFVNWTEGGSAVSTTESYTFTASADRNLVANFAPRLEILATPTNTLVLLWAAASPGYVLQENPNVDAVAGWTDCVNPANVVGLQNQVVCPLPTGNRFYRLLRR